MMLEEIIFFSLLRVITLERLQSLDEPDTGILHLKVWAGGRTER